MTPGERRSPLADRRFRAVLLVWAGVPVLAAYLWDGVLQPLLNGSYLGDLEESYMRGAARILAGQDPYDLCRTMGCLEPTGPQYVTPPALAWLLQPLVGANAHAAGVAAILVLNASLLLFLVLCLRALRVTDWQLAAVLVLVALGFEPVSANVNEGQVNLVLLALSGMWLSSWVAGGWWGGLALGIAVALKLIQGPVGLLVLWARRWRALAAAAGAGLALWLVAVPQYLPEYVLKVLPLIGAGTGFYENHSPGGTVTRLIEPDTFFGAVRGSPPAARIITALIAIAVLAITALILRSPSSRPTGRALEAAAVVAATPLVATYSWGTHLVLLLLPMLVLTAWALRRRDWQVLALVAAGWLLIGPGHKGFQVLLVSGYSDLVVLRLMAEFGVVGISAVWIASLLAVSRERSTAASGRSTNGSDAAHEDGADGEKDDRAREHHPVSQVG